jgi:hypothetical protein
LLLSAIGGGLALSMDAGDEVAAFDANICFNQTIESYSKINWVT